jgi:CheY-like chemotaxis protein
MGDTDAPRASRRVILVVEDDPVLRGLVADVAAESGAEIDRAGDGAEAIAAIRRRRPDLILLDLMMPGIDGWRFLEIYRQLPGPHAPVVVLSAASAPARFGVAPDVSEVIAKPFSIDHLLEVVQRHLGR